MGFDVSIGEARLPNVGVNKALAAIVSLRTELAWNTGREEQTRHFI